MKSELVQVGRCRQLLQDRHLLERKEEEERLRSKVAEVKNVFRQSLFLSFWTKTEFIVCRRSQLITPVLCQKCWQMGKRCGTS